MLVTPTLPAASGLAALVLLKETQFLARARSFMTTSCAPVMLRCRAKANEMGAFLTTIGLAAILTARNMKAVSAELGNMIGGLRREGGLEETGGGDLLFRNPSLTGGQDQDLPIKHHTTLLEGNYATPACDGTWHGGQVRDHWCRKEARTLCEVSRSFVQGKKLKHVACGHDSGPEYIDRKSGEVVTAVTDTKCQWDVDTCTPGW